MSDSSLAGERIGHIRLLEVLATGGMGEVYLAFDETLKRTVAVKAIRAEGRRRPELRERFLQEARILSKLDHPNICRIYDYVTASDTDYLVLELIKGRTLGDAIARGSLGRSARLEVAQTLATALAAAHASGAIHGDLKPGNVMLTLDGEVKILDFGLARLRGPGPEPVAGSAADQLAAPSPAGAPATAQPLAGAETIDQRARSLLAMPAPAPMQASVDTDRPLRIVGTPLYMSPEQAAGEAATAASDMYSYGLLLQELFTGRPARPAGGSPAETLSRARSGDTTPLETGRRLDKDLAGLIRRLESPAASARPTAAQVVDDLRWIREKPGRRRRRVAALALLLVALLAGLKYTLDLRAARDEAEHRRQQAEQLVGFMLGDLKSELQSVGRLDAMAGTLDEVLRYVDSLPEEGISDQDLAFRARALRQIGEVQRQRGDLPGAAAAYAEAARLTELLAARDPERAERLFELGESHFYVGLVHLERGHLEAALVPFLRYHEVARRLAAMDPDNSTWQMEVAYAEGNLGVVRERQGDLTAALDAYRSSLALREQVVDRNPDHAVWLHDLAEQHNLAGYVLFKLGDLAGAREHFEADLDLSEELLTRDPRSARFRRKVARSHAFLGLLEEVEGDAASALRRYRAEETLARELVALEPDNAHWRRQLAINGLTVGRMLRLRGDLPAAEELLRASQETLTAIAAADSSDPQWRRELAAARLELGAILLAAGRATDAEQEARDALSLVEPIAAAAPDRRVCLRLGGAHLLLGRSLAAQSLPGGAEALGRAAATVGPCVERFGDPLLLELWARVLLRQGRLEEAAPVVERLYRIGVRRPALMELAAAAGLLPENVEAPAG